MVLPNQLTVLRIILTPVFMILFLSGEKTLVQISFLVFMIAALTDWYDGWLARKFNYITSWGKFLDPLADKILTSAAFLAFVFIGVLELWMVLIVIARDLIITGLRSFAEFQKIAFSTSRSAKLKTFVQMSFIYYLLLIFALGTIEDISIKYSEVLGFLLNKELIYYLMLIVTFLTVFTGVQYLLKNGRIFRTLLKNET